MREIQAGDRIGEFVLREKLGEGGFGVVWKAENPDLRGQIVAIKFPSKGSALGAMRVEAIAQFKLQHPRIVRTLSLNLKHEPPYAVLEFVDGQSLRDRLQVGGILSEGEILTVGRDVLEACAYAHSQDLVHGDLSSANIIVDHDGRAHVADFGLARNTSEAQTSVWLSRNSTENDSSSVQGTLPYIAPELRGGGQKSKSSDVFALGILFLEMATTDPSFLRLPIEDAPAWLSGLVEKATHRVAAKRFGNAGEMLESLLQAKLERGSEKVVTAPSQVSEQRTSGRLDLPTVTSGRLTMAVVFGAAVLLVLAGVTIRLIPGREASPPQVSVVPASPDLNTNLQPHKAWEPTAADLANRGKETSDSKSWDEMFNRAEWEVARTKRWRQLRKGLTQGQVRELLGEPHRVEMTTGELWTYRSGGFVIFIESSLESWSEPTR